MESNISSIRSLQLQSLWDVIMIIIYDIYFLFSWPATWVHRTGLQHMKIHLHHFEIIIMNHTCNLDT